MRAIVVLLFLSIGLLAADWPEWRGPRRDGSVPLPARAAWPEKLTQRWKIDVGEGHSSPVSSGGRVYVFSREKGREVARAVDPASGKVLWSGGYAAPYKMNSAALHHGEGPKSTPLVHQGRLYTLGISGILTCWDAATGKQVWQKEFSKEFPTTSPLYGTATSPIVAGGQLVVAVGGHDRGRLAAFDLATGAVKWQTGDEGPGYSSPVLAQFGGVPQIVTLMQSSVAAYGAGDGKKLWSYPFKTDYDQNSITPLVFEELVILGGLENGTLALKPVRSGTAWKVELAWQTKDVALYMSTPVLRGGVLHGLSYRNKGQYFTMEPRTGKVLSKGDPRQGDNASLLVWGDQVVGLATTGVMTVQPAGKKYTVSDTEVWAHPLLLEKGVVVKDHHTLALWGME